MFRVVIPAVMAVALTACGGGGGGSDSSSPTQSSEYTTLASVNLTHFVPSLVTADFQGNGSEYVVMSGWRNDPGSAPPVKIFKINSDGTAEDATVAVLGSEVYTSVNYPVIADFNRDGIDDIFFPGFTDGRGARSDNQSRAFVSRPGQSHVEVSVPGLGWSHAAVAADINNDGWIDVISSMGNMWINNGGTAFTFQARYDYHSAPEPIGGSGICAGKLDNTNTTYFVVTDIQNNGLLPIRDTMVFTLDSTLKPVYQASLPVPFFDRSSTTTETSHDVSCMIADLNNDGLNDVVVVSALNSAAVQSGAETLASATQVYLNRGGLVFEDITDVAMPNYPRNSLSSYTPRVVDFNGDGKKDIWLQDWNFAGLPSANQIWLNTGAGLFSQSKVNEISNVLSTFRNRVGGDPGTGIMTPVKVNNKWNFIVTSSGTNRVNVGYVRTEWTF